MQRRLLQSFVAAQRKFQLRDLHCAKEQLDLEIERLDTLKFDSARRKMRRPEQPGHLDSASQPATNPGRAKNNAARYVSSRDQKQNSRRKQDMQGTRDNQINSERKEPKPPSLKEFNQAFQGPLQLVRNEDYMPFLSYIAKPKDIPSLINGQIRPDMDRRVLLKAKEALTNSAQKTEALAAQKLDRWNSSNYQLGELHPARESSSDLTPEMALDTIKDELCIILDTDAAGFEEIKALALKEYRAPPSGTREGNIAHETALQKIIQDNIKSSQNESLAAEKLQVLLGNPYWPHEKKARFLRKLVSELKSV